MKRRALMTLVVATAALATLVAPAYAGQVGVTVSIQGSGSTSVVEGSIEDSLTGTCNQTANKDDRVTNSCDRFRNEETFEAWVWLRPTASSVPSGHWRFLRWEGCDQTRTGVTGVTECAVHSPCCSAVEKFPKAVFDDFVAPTVSAISETFSTSVERNVAFAFSTNEGTLSCRIDSDSTFDTCSSGVSRTFATEGLKTIEVRATDASGNTSSISSRTVKVIDTAIAAGGPSGLVNSRTATFTYSSGAGNAYDCALHAPGVSPTFSDCGAGTTKTYTGLLDGAYVFHVRAKESSWYDRIPATRSFTVDATPPETTFTSDAATPGEGSMSTLTTATFRFSGGATYECQLDGGGWAACTSPRQLTGLSPGAHKFEVRARDTAQNVDATPATRNWTIAQPDADGDGYHAGIDCNDGNAAIRPGAVDSPGNGVDEDCSGADTPAPTTTSDGSSTTGGSSGATASGGGGGALPAAEPLSAAASSNATLSLKSKVVGPVTRLTALKLSGVPGAASVEVICGTRAKGCPFKTKTLTAPAAGGSVSLFKLVRTARFRSGAVLSVKVTKPGVSARTLRVTFRKGKAPKVTIVG